MTAETVERLEGEERRERGAALVELVLTMPILVCLVAAGLDAAFFLRYQIEADACATAAVRYLMDYPDRVPDSTRLCGGGEMCAAGYAQSGCGSGCGGGSSCTCTKDTQRAASADLQGLEDYLRDCYPALFKTNADAADCLTVAVDDGDREYQVYEHKIQLSDGMYSREGSTTTTQDVAVKVTYKTTFPTAIGALLTSDHLLTAEAVQRGSLDRTGGATW